MVDLKLLVDPVYTAKRVSRCAIYWSMDRFAKVFQDHFPNAKIDFIIPSDDSGFDVDIERREGWNYIPIRCRPDRYFEWFFPSDEHTRLFNEFNGKYGDWDVVITTRSNGPYWRHLISNSSQTVKMLCLRESFPQLRFKKTACSRNKSKGVPITVRTVSSYLDFDVVYVECDYERDSIIKEAKCCFSPSMLAALRRKLKVFFPTFDQWMLDFHKTEEAKEVFLNDQGLKILYTQRIGTTQRRFHEVFKALSRVYVLLSGENVSITICTNSTDDLPKFAQADSKFFEFKRPDRNAYYDLCKRSHIVMSFSLEEGLPTGLVEALLLGCIGIFYKTGWSVGLCGKDYPFFVNSHSDAAALIKLIAKNKASAFEKYQKWMQGWFIDNIVTKHRDMSIFAEDVQQHFKEQIDLCKGYKNPVGSKIVLSDDVDEVDLLNVKCRLLPDSKDLRNIDISEGAYFKLARRWVSHFWLRAMHGYRRTDKPWVLRKPEM